MVLRKFLAEKLPSQVVFSDEKRFSVYGDRPVRVWRKSDQKFTAGYTASTRKFSKSIMVWLAINSAGRSVLMLCPDRMDGPKYQSEILTPALPFLRKRATSRRGDIVFMQDGATPHTSSSTARFLYENRVTVLQEWPAMSPDLNPVENCWTFILNRLVGQSFSSPEDLWSGVYNAWCQVPVQDVTKLYCSMVRRLTAVTVAKGGNTKY